MRIPFIIHEYHQSVNFPPMWTAYLARVLRECGREVEI